MNIGFDAKRLFLNYTGLGNYARFIVQSLAEQFPEHQYYLFSPEVKRNSDTIPFFDRENIHIITPTQREVKSLWRSFGQTRIEEFKGLSIYHGLSHELPLGIPHDIKKVVTIHDLIFLRYPQFYKWIDRKIYTAKVKYACNKADAIVAISEQTARDIETFLGIERSKINVVYQGTHPQFNTPCTNEDLKRVKITYDLPDKFILNVGTIESRKNLLVIIRALGKIAKENRPHLVVVGKRTPYFLEVLRSIDEYSLQQDVTFLHGVKFTDLPAIYQQASLFVYPSLFEGFGIPIIEAIKSRIPVITSTGSCFQEAGGQDVLYLDPNDADGYANVIQQVLGDEEYQRKMIEHSLRYIERFSDKSIASAMMRVYTAI